MNTQKTSGFTLIEMVIVVAIVGILAAIAIPNYQKYVLESRRTDATRSIMECAAALERRFTLTNNYPLTADGAATRVCNTRSRDQYYTINVTNPWNNRNGQPCRDGLNNNICYRIQATIPNNRFGNPNPQVADQADCTRFRMDDRGVKTDLGAQSEATLGNGLGRCWRS